MITYLDTSAFLPLVIREPGSAAAERVWAESDSLVASRLLVVEATAALAMAQRQGRVSADDLDEVVAAARRLWRAMHLVDAATEVIDAAATLARELPVRGYDAVHLATAELIRGDDVLFASGDRALLRAAGARGLHTLDTAAPSPPGSEA